VVPILLLFGPIVPRRHQEAVNFALNLIAERSEEALMGSRLVR